MPEDMARMMDSLKHNDGYRVFKELLDSLIEHVAILDEKGNIIEVNRAWTEFTLNNSQAPHDALGQNYLLVCDRASGRFSQEAPAVAKGIRDILGGSRAELKLEYPCHSQKEPRWFLMHATPMVLGGATRGAIISHIPITERKFAEEALKASESRFSNAFDCAYIGMALISLDGYFFKVNQSLCDMLGYSMEEMEKLTYQDLTFKEDQEASSENFSSVVEGARKSYQFEKRYVRKDGEVIWVRVSVSLTLDQKDKPLHLVAQIENIDRQKKLEIELLQLAATDSLTGLYNRRHFLERAQEEFIRCRRYNLPASFLMLDIDHFKRINDTYGHAAGDLVLKGFADSLRASFRQNDIIGRLGGEEFCVLLPQTDFDYAQTIAHRICDAIERQVFNDNNVALQATVSIGVAALSPGDKTLEDVMKRADEMLYKAKALGRNRVVSQ